MAQIALSCKLVIANVHKVLHKVVIANYKSCS